MPEHPPHSSVVALAYDGLCTFEFGCTYEIFGLPRPELDRPWYRFEVCAAEPGPLRAAGGLAVEASFDLDLIEQADTVVVPGWSGPDHQPSRPLLDALARVPERGGRLVSICSGVFVLAAAGVLDGRRATTHWRYADALARRYPRILRRSGRALRRRRSGPDVGRQRRRTGSVPAHVVRRDHGAAVANNVARRLVLAPHRDGGQQQFVETPVAARPQTGRLAALLDWLSAHIDEELSVGDIARRSGMSLRTFQRRFREATGTAPGDWLIRQRVACACHLAETTDLTIEQIATRSGFGAAETLRHHFRRLVGISPATYRRTFTRLDEPSPPRRDGSAATTRRTLVERLHSRSLEAQWPSPTTPSWTTRSPRSHRP